MDFEVPADRRYLETHEWITLDDGVGTVGITDFAQDELGDVIFVELPAEDESLSQEAQFGTVESIKAVSDLYIPMSGTVVEINERLLDEPELVNEDPYGDAWMVKIEITDEDEYDALLTDEAYREQTE